MNKMDIVEHDTRRIENACLNMGIKTVKKAINEVSRERYLLKDKDTSISNNSCIYTKNVTTSEAFDMADILS